MTEKLNAKQERAREWLKALTEDEPGEWWLDKEDMQLIKEALNGWLKQSSNYKPSIQVFIDGIPYEVR